MSSIRVEMIAETRAMRRGIDSVNSQLGTVGKTAGKMSKLFKSAFVIAGGAIAASKVVDFLGDCVSEGRESNKVFAQTQAVLKSTGGVAGVTAKQVGTLANALSKKVGIDDEAIQSNENLLLTFTNIRNEVGKGNDIFNQATKSVLDMAAATGVSGKSAVLQLGKALNDPITGVTKLTRVGVTFTDQQKAQIKTLVESGKTLQAQKIILGEVKREFGGSAKAIATPGDKLKVTVSNIKETIGKDLIPYLDKLGVYLNKNLPQWFATAQKWFKKNQDTIEDLGHTIGTNLITGLKTLGGIVQTTVKFIASLPAPVRKFGAEALIAYAVLVKLNPQLTALTNGFSNLAGPVATSESRMNTLKGSAKSLAGTAGIGLLGTSMFSATQKGDGLANMLTGTLGGALTGLAVGGPIGALVGGAAGLGLTGLAGAFHHVSAESKLTQDQLIRTEGFKEAKKAAQNLGQALDGVINKYAGVVQAAIKSNILQNKDLTKNAQFLRAQGVSWSTITQAQLGNAKALKIVNAAYNDQNKLDKQNIINSKARIQNLKDANVQAQKNLDPAASKRITKSYQDESKNLAALTQKQKDDAAARAVWNKSVEVTSGHLQKHHQRMKDLADDLGITFKAFKKIPKDVRTDIEANGLPQTNKAAIQLIGHYRDVENFRDIKTIISAPGVDLTTKQIDALGKKYGLTPKQITTLIKIEGTTQANSQLDTVQGKIKLIPTRKDSYIYVHTIDNVVHTTGGHTPKNDNGPQSGDSGGASRGVTTSKALTEAAKKANKAVLRLTKAIEGGKDSLNSALDNFKDRISKAFDKREEQRINAVTKAMKKNKDTAKEIAKRVKEIKANYKDMAAQAVKSLSNEEAHAQRIAKRYTALTEKLSKAKDAYNSLKNAAKDYFNQVKSSVVDSGDITTLNTAFNSHAIVGGLAAQLAKARRFAAVLKDLKKKGLDQTSLAQIVNAGVDGGLAYAIALDTGPLSDIKTLKSLQTQLAAAGADIGTTARDSMYKAGLATAQGLVDGLQAKVKDLGKIAKKMAAELLKALRKALGIHSPSKQFKKIGQLSIDGLVQGLDATPVTKAMTGVSQAMLGFDPKLTTPKVNKNVAPVYITINTGVGDPVAIAKEVNKVLATGTRAGVRQRA